MHPWGWGYYENTFIQSLFPYYFHTCKIHKKHKKLFSGIPINFTFLSYLQNYKEFEAEILDLQLEKYGLSFDIKNCTTSGWAQGDENVIGIRSFNHVNWFVHVFTTDVYHNCHNLTVLSLPVKKPFVSRYSWIIDCFLQVTGHWHQVWITPRGTSITYFL